MKSVTEFQSVTLLKGMKAKAALAAEGKSPEEIQTGLGEAFKMEGDKLKHFNNAIEVASANQEGLTRVLVVTFNEGEQVPPKALAGEGVHYVPEIPVKNTGVASKKDSKGSERKEKRGPKESPWGMSPEQKAAKKAGSAAKAAADKKTE